MSDDFYRAFEDRYRGSRELIMSRLEAYMPFVQPLLTANDGANAVDLGCGRGEWLELISGLGFDALGVDLDQGMLDAAHQLGLNVEKGDAIAFISAMPDESQSVVSAFHVVEHVTFEQLRTLVSQALRILKPGGLLIMETPNPENIMIATRNFYLDPTHDRPIPPELLSFLPEYYGFARTKVLRLQESKELVQRIDLTLQDVFGGASPDYAVVAQKAGPENLISSLDTPFSLEYGLSLENLTGRYQDQISARFQQAESKVQQAETALIAIQNSASWRLTAPLRMVGRTVKSAFHLAKVTKPKSKDKIKLLLTHTKLYINQRPKLRRIALAILAHTPTLVGRIKQVTSAVSSEQRDYPPTVTKLANLPPRARQIYDNLKVAIEKHSKESKK